MLHVASDVQRGADMPTADKAQNALRTPGWIELLKCIALCICFVNLSRKGGLHHVRLQSYEKVCLSNCLIM